MAVSFSSTVKIKTPSKTLLKTWVKKIASSEEKILKSLAYNFCSDEELLQMNKQFLRHNTYTDIITFDYSEGNTLSGEIYISVDRVKENAARFKTETANELLRVMAHGVLHLCGYKDKSPLQQKKMRAAEDRALKLYRTIKS
jgi:rRNA maturation RNase YbeY